MWTSWLLEQIFPSRCIVCARRGTALCRRCRDRLPYMPTGVCRRCATILAPRGACRGCRNLSPALNRVWAALAYDGPARRAVVTLKFRGGRYLVETMGDLMRDAVRLRPVQADLVVPVPLAPRRLRARGFNQAELLARELMPVVGGALTVDLLRRVDRPPQQTLAATERLTNLRGTFACTQPGSVRGRTVLLVDDVITTGATVSACADTLADAGAARVCALAFARDL
jgi:ComF family protein